MEPPMPRLLLVALALSACGGKDTGDTDPADASDTGAAADDTAEDTGDTAKDDETGEPGETGETGDTGARTCPKDITGVCGTISGTKPAGIFVVELYPDGVAGGFPAAQVVFDGASPELELPLLYLLTEKSFAPDAPVAGAYDAYVIADSNADGIPRKDEDTTWAYAGNPITVTEGVTTVGVDFAL